MEVKEPPQGMQPPTQNIVKKPQLQPSRLRKFVAKNSAGLRIRAHPSLQSEQIGFVSVNGTIAFVDEVIWMFQRALIVNGSIKFALNLRLDNDGACDIGKATWKKKGYFSLRNSKLFSIKVFRKNYNRDNDLLGFRRADSQRRRRLATIKRGDNQGILQQQSSRGLVLAIQPAFRQNLAVTGGRTEIHPRSSNQGDHSAEATRG